MAQCCPECDRELVEIRMERGTRTFTLRSCSSCDRREWNLDGDHVPLNGVLAEFREFEAAAR